MLDHEQSVSSMVLALGLGNTKIYQTNFTSVTKLNKTILLQHCNKIDIVLGEYDVKVYKLKNYWKLKSCYLLNQTVK